MAIAVGVSFFILLRKVHNLKYALKNRPINYIDRSGVKSTKEMNFVDLKVGKTINFKVGDQVVSIGHLPWTTCLQYITKITALYNLLAEMTEFKPKDNIEELKQNIRYDQIYKEICKLIYQVSYGFAGKKFGYKRRFMKQAREDIGFVTGICEQIIDYWNPVKKKLKLLANGQTLASTLGGRFTWSSLELDRAGKVLIKPRFGNSLNTSTK